MIDARPVTNDDIRHVVYRMWQRGKDEMEKYRIADREILIRHFAGKAHEYGYAFYKNNEPVAVFGASCEQGVYYTWFMATEAFVEIGKEATKWLKRFTRARVVERPGQRLELHTAVDHPEAEKWFGFLGFRPMKPEGIFQRYNYDPENLLTINKESANIKIS